MNLNVSIFDQRLTGMQAETSKWAQDEVKINTPERLWSWR